MLKIKGHPRHLIPGGTEYILAQLDGEGSVGGRTVRIAIADLAQALAHQSISGAGTNTHAQIDTQLAAINLQTSTQTLSDVSGATVTATGVVPAGSFLIGVSTKVLVALGTVTGYNVGDGVDADMYGVAATATVGTVTDNSDATVDPTKFSVAAANVVLTGVGGSFDGTGDIQVTAHYLDITAP